MSTPQYTLVLTLSDATIQALSQGGFSLYGYAGLGAPPAADTPVWFQAARLARTLTLTWSNAYAAYTRTTQPIAGGGQLTGMNVYPVQIGDTLTVTDPTGLGTVAAGGPPGSVSVINQSGAELTCGLALAAPGSSGASPVSAVQLFPHQAAGMTPGTDVFLVFRTQSATETVTLSGTSAGVLVPFGDGTTTQTVAFDVNTGWSGAGTVYPQTEPQEQ